MIVLAVIVAYIVYILFVRVLIVRKRYSKYPNVCMVSKFFPGFGDYHMFAEDDKQGRVPYHSFLMDAERSNISCFIILNKFLILIQFKGILWSY